MKFNLERARQYKEERGLNLGDGEKGMSDVLYSILGSITRETERILNIYNQKFGHRPERLVLSGGSAMMPGLKEYFQNNLKVEVSVANPFKKVVYPQELGKKFEQNGSTFSIAVGLAMKGLE